MTSSDHELICRVVAGELGAFAPLVAKYEGSISHCMFRIVGDRDLAADITQQAFVSAFEHLSSFDPDHRFFSWLYRIAWNDAINRYQYRKNNKPLDQYEFPSREPSPEDCLMAKEQRGNLKRAMENLDYKYRVVLVLRHYLELSYAEIGKIVNLPVSTVRSRIHTARALLRQDLTEIPTGREMSMV